MVKNGEITEQQAKRLKPQDCHAPRLIGYPKIHKEKIPLHGVVSTIESPYEMISKALKPILGHTRTPIPKRLAMVHRQFRIEMQQK